MKINLLLAIPVMGELSPNTVKTEVVICESCKRRKTQYTNITYIFDRWRGEDIISGSTQFFISQRLKEKLDERNIKGFKLTPIKTSFSEQRGGIRKFGKGHIKKNYLIFIILKLLEEQREILMDGLKLLIQMNVRHVEPIKKCYHEME
jgi:hypothetical protein